MAAVPPSSFPVMADPDPSLKYKAMIGGVISEFATKYAKYSESPNAVRETVLAWQNAAQTTDWAAKVAVYNQHRNVREDTAQILERYREVIDCLLPDGERPFVPQAETLLLLQNLQAIDLKAVKPVYDNIFTKCTKTLKNQKVLFATLYDAISPPLVDMRKKLENLVPKEDKSGSGPLADAFWAVVGRSQTPYVKAAVLKLNQEPAAPAAAAAQTPVVTEAADAAGPAAGVDVEESSFPIVGTPTLYSSLMERVRAKYNSKYAAYAELSTQIDKLRTGWTVIGDEARPDKPVLKTQYTERLDQFIGYQKQLEEIRTIVGLYKKALEYLLPNGRPPVPDTETLLLLHNLDVITLSDAKKAYDEIFTTGVAQLKDQMEKIQAAETAAGTSLQTMKSSLERLARRSSDYTGFSRPWGTPFVDDDLPKRMAVLELRPQPAAAPAAAAAPAPVAVKPSPPPGPPPAHK
ncbi:MAG TPA: hypothetical protein VLF94_02135 [Chlamydiales bacterium]|nr:hypothetical protein [Chlamydiales bacterium]